MKLLSKEEFEMIYSKVPRVCIDLLIESKNGILLTKRAIAPNRGFWYLPGGGILFNESVKDACRRISRKELGCEDIKIVKKIGYIEFLDEKDNGFSRHSISIVFLAKINSEKIVLNDEASEFMFTKKIPENTYKEHNEFLINFLKER